MNYAQAKAIAADCAPKLIVDPEVKDKMSHFCMVVRAAQGGETFTIHLPLPLAGRYEDEKKVLTDGLTAAMSHLKVSK